jgi:Tfp pilus assembly protein PilO
MIAFIGGVIAFILGIIGLVVWWYPFITMFKAVLPVIFLLGGAVAAYIGSQEVRDKIKAHREAGRQPLAKEGEEQAETLDRYRNEVSELKDRLAALEKNKEPESENKEEK